MGSLLIEPARVDFAIFSSGGYESELASYSTKELGPLMDYGLLAITRINFSQDLCMEREVVWKRPGGDAVLRLFESFFTTNGLAPPACGILFVVQRHDPYAVYNIFQKLQSFHYTPVVMTHFTKETSIILEQSLTMSARFVAFQIHLDEE